MMRIVGEKNKCKSKFTVFMSLPLFFSPNVFRQHIVTLYSLWPIRNYCFSFLLLRKFLFLTFLFFLLIPFLSTFVTPPPAHTHKHTLSFPPYFLLFLNAVTLLELCGFSSFVVVFVPFVFTSLTLSHHSMPRHAMNGY